MPELERKLGLLDSIFLVVGSVLGSGIFLTTGIIAKDLPSHSAIWLVWIVGGLFTLCGALTYGELGAQFPKSGGPYVYLKEAYGSGAAFLYGWGYFWIIGGGGIAALAVGCAEYVGAFLPGLSPSRTLVDFNLGVIHFRPSAGQLVAVAAIVGLSALNYRGIQSGARLQNGFSALRILAILVLAGLGIAIGKKAGLPSLSAAWQGWSRLSWRNFAIALVPVLWAYDGWYSVNCTAEEVKNPSKNIPLGLTLGTLTVILLYLLANIVYSIALPAEKMSGIVRIGEAASVELFGPSGGIFLSGLILLAIFGCLSANLIFCPRVPFAMARDGLFFRSLAFVHPKFHVPSKAITAQMVWGAILCLSGTYQSLYEYVVFALVLFFIAAGLSVILLRRKDPERVRPYKAWGYPVLPLVFVAVNIVLFINMIISRPLQCLAGAFFLVLGLPAYLFWKTAKPSKQDSSP